MPQPRNYYIRYSPGANVDYRIIFSLMAVAEYDVKSQSYSKIRYSNYQQLAKIAQCSVATITRVLSFKGSYIDYSKFIQIDKKQKVITLMNSFKGRTHIRYVSLPPIAFRFLRLKDDNLLIKYYLYLKYYYSLSMRKGIDNTAK